MDSNGYVVYFNGISIPHEDVCTHDTNMPYDQAFYDIKEKEALAHENKFKRFLKKEEIILKDGFRAWCESEFLNGPDGSLNYSMDTSLTKTTPCIFGAEYSDVSKQEISQDRSSFNNEEISCDVVTEASKTDTEEYWCRIDPSVFVLTDMDYIRAKCRWQFQHVTDFETNPKIIEHLRYLDLFTQCFSLRLLHDNALDKKALINTCYTFLSNDINRSGEMIYGDKLKYKYRLKAVAEKEYNYECIEEPTETVYLDENTFIEKPFSKSNNCEDDIDHAPVAFRSNHDDSFNQDSFEVLSTCEIEKESAQNFGNNHRTNFKLVLQEEVNRIKRSSSISKIKDKEKHINEENDKVLTFQTEEHAKSKGMKPKEVNNSVHKVHSNNMSDMKMSSSDLDTNDSVRLRTIHYIKSSMYESSSVSEPSVESKYFSKTEQKQQFSRYKNHILLENTKKVTKKFNEKLKLSNHSETIDSIGAEGSSSILLHQFIKGSRKRSNNHNTKESDQSSEVSLYASTNVLDSIFHDKSSKIEKLDKVKNQPIIVIGLKYGDEDQEDKKSEKSKANTRVRRYIEGDNLCNPGRYAACESKNILNDLDASNELNIMYNMYESGDFKEYFKTCSDLKNLQQFNKSNLDIDIRSDISSNEPDKSLGSSSNVSTSTTMSLLSDKLPKGKKSKRNICKNCRRNDDELKTNTLTGSNVKYSSSNVYASCWKRFCVIL